MESLTGSPLPVNNIREKLASQISPAESPVGEVKRADVEKIDEEENKEHSIDGLVGIDPAFVLEDETSRNTHFNASLYDQELDSSSISLVPDKSTNDEYLNKYRLMESTSSLSLESENVIKPTPLRPINTTFVSSPLSQAHNGTTPLASPSPLGIRSNLKSPLSSPKQSPTVPSNSMYEKRIAFDTLQNSKANNSQLILKTKHKEYKYTRISRTFLCGYDDHEYSETALKWAMDELMDDGDMIVCLKVLAKEDLRPSHNYALENEKIMEKIMQFNKSNKKISILLEISVSSKVSKKIMQAISDYEPSLLIVGTSGVQKKGFKNIISPKSMSKYCLQYSDIPVVVVRPTYKKILRTKSCITIAKAPKRSTEQSLDKLVMSESDSEEEDETVEINKNFYKNLLESFVPLAHQAQQNHNQQSTTASPVEERPTRATRPRSSIFPRALTPQKSHELTPTSSASAELLRPTRSRGFSPVRSLSPFWKKNT